MADRTTPVVETQLADGVLTVTMVDEERRNALSAQLLRELTEAFDDADRRDEVRVVVLTNRGSTFCAGADLAERAVGAPTIPPQELFDRFARSPKPYVARIAGHCIAGGMGLAAAVDVAVAADDVRFGFTEVRIGAAPAMISVVCLPLLRTVDARAAFLRGNRFSAAEAAAMGLLHAAVPRAGLDAAVQDVVADLLLGGPEALAATKQLLLRVPTLPRHEAFAWTAEVSAERFASEEAAAGMAAFREKRLPPWAPPGTAH